MRRKRCGTGCMLKDVRCPFVADLARSRPRPARPQVRSVTIRDLFVVLPITNARKREGAMPKESPVSKSKFGNNTNNKAKISLEELRGIMANPKISKQDLAKYFLIDENRSGLFYPALQLNPDTVDIKPALWGEEIFTEAYNKSARNIRWREFQEKIEAGYKGPIIVSEGDSWFMFPLQFDIIDSLNHDFAIHGVEGMGNTLQKMVNEGEYLEAVQETNPSVFLLSGGGNDALGGGLLKEQLRDFDPSLSASEHLLPSFSALLDHAITLYDRILQSIEERSNNILILCHGYDYAIPRNQKWLGQPMNERGITDSAFQASIVSAMIDQFNVRLRQLIDKFSNARYLDLRGLVGPSRWFDELHPTYTAFAEIAAKFKAEIDKSAASYS
jgi:metacaspase-1